MSKFVIGVDGGGSKTEAVILNEQGQTLGRGRSGAANYHLMERSGLVAALMTAMTEAATSAGVDLSQAAAVTWALAGAGRPEEVRKLQSLQRELLPNIPGSVVTDALAALVGGTGARTGVVVIAITNDENGISYDAKGRFAVAKKIVKRAESYGIPPEDILIDPLAMPAGAVGGSAKTLFEIVRMVNEELGCNTTCGASNISFGLPNREALNAAFVAMAIASGMTSAITNPLKPEIMMAIKAADALMGYDENCANWIMANRKPPAEGESGARRRPRRRPRREQ